MFFSKRPRVSSYTRYSSYRRRRVSSLLFERRSLFSKFRKFIPNVRGVKILGGLLLCIGILYGLYLLFFSQTFIVDKVALFEKDKKIEHDIILSEVATFKGQSLFKVNSTDLKQEILAKYPEIETVKISKKLPDSLYVYITKYPVVANVRVKVDKIERKYLLSSKGIIAMPDMENLSFPLIILSREKAFNSRERVMEEAELDSILKSIKLFEQKFQMKILRVEFLPKAREYHLITEKNFSLWMDLTKDYRAQLSRLKAAEQKLNIHTTSLEYVDLRIAGNKGEKVIFKRR